MDRKILGATLASFAALALSATSASLAAGGHGGGLGSGGALISGGSPPSAPVGGFHGSTAVGGVASPHPSFGGAPSPPHAFPLSHGPAPTGAPPQIHPMPPAVASPPPAQAQWRMQKQVPGNGGFVGYPTYCGGGNCPNGYYYDSDNCWVQRRVFDRNGNFSGWRRVYICS